MKPIHHTFAPLADAAQIRTAAALLMQPWRWRTGAEQAMLTRALEERFGGEAYLFLSGREALLAVLRSLTFKKDEEVIMQGYTCVVVPNAVIAAGMTPVYADIEPDTLNLDLEEVERLITPRTRAVICQHTFGIPSYAKRLRDLCDRHSLVLIEDCAHVMPDQSGPADVGIYGDVTFFSFGRDKAISGVSGGAAICRLPEACAELKRLHQDAVPAAQADILRLLLYPLLYALAKPLYGIGAGKVILAVASMLQILPRIVGSDEKRGRMKPRLHSMPNACALLALQQLHRLKKINDHRRMLTRLYFEEASTRGWPLLLGVRPDLPLQKFPIFVPQAERIRTTLKARNIHLHDGWTGCVICPASADAEAVGYRDGDDPKADMAGKQILSLPTHPDTTPAQARRLITLLDPLLP